MKLSKKDFYSTAVLLVIISIVFYLIVRISLFLTGKYTVIEKFFAVLLILGETFVLMHALGYVVNVFRVMMRPAESLQTKIKSMPAGVENPAVAVLVAARHEPKQVLEETFITINNLDYGNKQVYLLDDSTDDKYKKEAEELSRELNFFLFRRKQRHGAKAGIINDCLKTLKQKYIVIFDADQNPLPQFLNMLMPLMESDEKLAFIQTPQFYSNMEQSGVTRGAAFQQAVFYEYICEGKSSDGAMFCCGTNIIFRREALLDVGGLDESTVTEDFATSVKLHSKGWKSLYSNHVYAFGMAPENLSGYFQQQFRWAAGTISVLKQLIWRFITRPFSLRPMQWWEYFLSSSYYLIGLAFFFMLICPIVYSLFRIPSFFIKPEIYFLAFVPYITLSISVFYMVLGVRNYKISDLFVGQMLGIIAITVYIRAALSALFGVKISFGITSKAKGRRLSYVKLWPQMGLLFLTFVAFVWGMNRFVYERETALLVNGFWMAYHFIILLSVFYFNQDVSCMSECRQLNPRIPFEYNVIEQREIGRFDKATWRLAFFVYLPQYYPAGTLLLCKLRTQDKANIIFDGIVIGSSQKSNRRGYKTDIAVLTATDDARNRLSEILH